MYEKQLMGRRPLYFRYAPPLTSLDDYSDDELPKLPFREAKPYQRSVYYYWWLFLREHEGYRATCEAGGKGGHADLYADFGDVRNEDFMKWWKRGGRLLFCEPQDEPIHVYPNPDFSLNDENRVVVSLPVGRDVEEMLAELRQLLKPLRKVAPLKQTSGEARYQVAAKPVLSSLHQHWVVLQLRKQHPNAALHELGDLAGVLVDEDNDRGTDPKQVRAITVSRYLKQAKCMIEHVGKGMFPVLKPIAPALVKRGR